MNDLYFTQLYKIPVDGEESWFDLRLDEDTELFIDPFLVFRSDIPIFAKAKDKFINFFSTAFELAHEARQSIDAFEKLKNILWFPEPMEIRLGLSKGKLGAGPGKKFAKTCTEALVNLAAKDYKGLDHFEKIEIFTSGIGFDGISDATANIIKQELIKYTQDVCEEFSIPTLAYRIRNVEFDFQDRRWYPQKFRLPKNPFLDNTGIILVPKEFLCAIPAISSERFSEYVIRNDSEELRVDLNYEIKKSFSKTDIIKIAEQQPEWLDKRIEEYIKHIESQGNINPYDLKSDQKNVYQPQRKTYEFASSNPLTLSAYNERDFILCVESIFEQFRLFIEEQGGFKLLWNEVEEDSSESGKSKPTPRDEKSGQCLFWGIVLSYCKANNIDISREVETGRGPVDFKFSSGYKNRVLIEIKLAKSSRLKQGFENQLPTYLKAQQVQHGYYIVIFYIEKELKQIEKFLEEVCSKYGSLQGKVIKVDATLDKPSASKL